MLLYCVWRVNSNEDISEIQLKTIVLDYMHDSLPVNPLCVLRLFESHEKMADSTTNNKNYYEEIINEYKYI